MAGWLGTGKAKRATLLGLSAVGVLGVVAVVVFRNVGQWLGRLEEQVRHTEQRLVAAVTATQQAEEVRQAFAAYEPFAQPAAAAAAERNQLLRDVEDVLRSAGMARLNFRELSSDDELPGTVGVLVDGESSPGQLLTFLDLLQRSHRLLRVTKLEARVSENRTLRCSLIVSKLLIE